MTPKPDSLGSFDPSISKEVEEQMKLLETHENEQDLSPEAKKSLLLRQLFDRLNQTTKNTETAHAHKVPGTKEVPTELQDKRRENDIELAKGEKALAEFVEQADKPYNLFHLDRSLSKEQLEERVELLDQLHEMYRSAPKDERFILEELINRMFGTPKITEKAQNYLDQLQAAESTVKPSGAENQNMIFSTHENMSMIHTTPSEKARVIKISKQRHDIDFTSVLKLMKNMHTMMLRFNRDVQTPEGQDVKLRFVTDDMTIYMDQESNYKRMIRQPFAEGESIQDAMKNHKNDPDFQDAWKTFLNEAESMKESDGIVLDLTDSAAPFPLNRTKYRGKVANTKNVFVNQEPDGGWQFSVIDPDVFDSAPGEHKFDPQEHRNLGRNLKAKIVEIMNSGRATTLGWQDGFSKKEREK
jgi:hypothetical protein